MKNELYIVLKGGDYLYFDTNKNTADEALQEFEEVCERVGINTDNVRIAKTELRNKKTGNPFSDKTQDALALLPHGGRR